MSRALRWFAIGTGPALLLAAWGFVLALASQGGLWMVVAWYLAPLVLPAAGLLGLGHAVLIAWRAPTLRLLAGVEGVVALAALVPLLMAFGIWTPAYPSRLDSTAPAATVRLPLDGPVVVGWGGDTVAQNYHAASPDQRWAYDLLVQPAAHGASELEGYGCYGLDVVAPASGTISIAHDGEPDMDPSHYVPNYDEPAGNHVAIELDDTHTHLVLAHLIPGSLTVGVGDRVEEGQPIGKCGNSGNTSEPHVHIHHVRQKPELIGFGEGLPLYFRDHDGAPMPTGGIRMDGDTVVLLGDTVQHRGAGTP